MSLYDNKFETKESNWTKNKIKLQYYNKGWKMVTRKLQVLETFHSILKSRNGIICDESQSLVFASFLESRFFLTFCSKISNF